MTSANDYRARVESVRRAARERLAEIRAERLSRKRYGARASDAPTAAAPSAGPGAEPLCELRYAASASAALFAAEAAGASGTEPDDEVVEIIELVEPMSPFQEAGDAVLVDDEPVTPRGRSSRPPEGTILHARAGLETLPGIGPGMIWVLQQRGMHSLADLASADKAQLREALGLLGPFIDIDGWVNHAQQSVD